MRDRLMGREPKDFDVATSATPEQVLKLFPRGQEVGAAFGVILVREKTGDGFIQVEIATFRSDGEYSDGRHPDSVHFTTAEKDAQRRDFTCNGLFLDPLANGGAGQLHDFVGGQADIAVKTLRAIGDPAARFREDHLRMLRAVRFAARLGFAVDETTMAAIQAAAREIKSVSKERVHDELARILSHETRARGAELLEETGLLEQIWPSELLVGWSMGTSDRWKGISRLPAEADFVVALAALHADIQFSEMLHPHQDPPMWCVPGARAAELLRRELMLANEETADLAWLLDKQHVVLLWRNSKKAPMKRLMADARWPRLVWMYATYELQEGVWSAFEKYVVALHAEPGGVAPAAFVNGETLIGLGAMPGPRFKGWLEGLYDRQLENEFADAEAAVAAARGLIKGG